MRIFKSKTARIIALAVAVLLVALLTYFIFIHPMFSGPKQTFKLYFLDSTGSSLTPEERSISVSDRVMADDEKLLKLLVEELIAGPKEQIASKRAIPKDTKVLSLEINADRIATVNLSKEFYAKTDLENTLAVHTIVLTICETNKADKVAVLVNGKEIISKSKVPLGALSSADIQNAAEPEAAAIPLTITLHFPSKDGQHLIIEERILQVDGAKIDATLVMNELIKGTTKDTAINIIPPSTKVLYCETKENICYVNLSKDFLEKKPSGTVNEGLVIDSIVQTLTELEGISKVMFLIEGEKVETYGQLLFNEPFARTESVPEEVEETAQTAE